MDNNVARKIAYDLTMEYVKQNNTDVFTSGRTTEGVERFAKIFKKYYDAVRENETLRKLYE